MAEQDLTELSNQQLAAKTKTLNSSITIMAIIASLYALFYVYLFITGTFDTDKHLLGLVPLGGLGLIAFVSRTRIKEMEQELDRRQ